jgi:integrase
VRARIDGALRTLKSKITLAEAEAVAAAFGSIRELEQLRQGITLSQFGLAFLDRRERAGVRGMRQDRQRWRTHIDQDPLGALPVTELGRRDVVEWLDRRVKLAPQTQRNALNLLRVALQEAVDRELLSSNPARDVKVKRARDATTKDELEGVLTPEEQQALVAAVPDGIYRSLVVFALCTGIRQSEQRWLEWEDVGAESIMVRRSVGGKPTKGGKPREVHLLPAARAALASLRRSSRLVFPATRGGRRQYSKIVPWPLWKRWLAAAGIQHHVRWHDLRHTCATSLLAGWWGHRWSLDEVCSMLGHSSVQVTERYARKLKETQRLAIAKTPGPVFPSGNEGEGNVMNLPVVDCAFVNRRSGVQIPKVAPALTVPAGEQPGNIGEFPADGGEGDDFAVAAGEDHARAEAFRERGR